MGIALIWSSYVRKCLAFIALQLLIAFLMFNLALLIVSSDYDRSKSNHLTIKGSSSQQETPLLLPITSVKSSKENQSLPVENLWSKAPRFSLFVRIYYGYVGEYWQIFAPSYLLFWPFNKWRNADLILVFDEDSIRDDQASTTLSLLPPYPKIVFEKPPPPDTTCSNWRREGFSRQIYSTFHADLATDAPFIGLAHSDTIFINKVVPEDLFENGKPRIFGYNGCCTGFEVAAGSIVPGKSRVGEFTSGLSFPFIVKREHFKQFRHYALSIYNTSTFDQFFRRICQLNSEYNAFDMLAFYLFHYHREDYAWHIRDNEQAKHPLLTGGRLTRDEEVLALSKAKIGVMKHAGHEGHCQFPFVMYDYICTLSDFSDHVGSCGRELLKYRDEIRKTVEQNLVTDLFVKTAYWYERLMPVESKMTRWPGSEKIPANSQQLFSERANILKRYNGSWHW